MRRRMGLVRPASLPMARRTLLGGVAALAAAPALSSMAAEPASTPPRGLDANGHFRAVALPPNGFAYARLREGVQLRVNGVSKNLIFYAPDTVRVNATLGENYWMAASLVVTAPPRAVPFSISETPTTLAIVSEKLRIEVDKASGALRFLDGRGRLYTSEKADAPQTLRKVLVSA